MDIGKGDRVFVIAEAGCNFEDSFEKAKEMVLKAAEAGADAIKFQTFIPDKLTTRDAPKFWDIEGCPGETQHDEFSAMYRLSFEQYKELKRLAEGAGILMFSTPCDEESADMLEKVGMPMYKIASMDITHIPLLKHIARKGKPVILSTGASTMEEVRDAVKAIEEEGNRQIMILHCITNYPTKPENVNLRMIESIKKEFPDYAVGYSDHTCMPESKDILIAAVAMGARVIEKHYTYDKSRPGYDHEISADYSDLRDIVKSFRLMGSVLGSGEKKPAASEEKARKFARRSLVAKVGIPEGTAIEAGMLTIKRPSTGIEPKRLGDVVGKKAARDIKEDEVLKWEMVA
jgi:N-acetylneuraminate synthase